MTTLQLVNSLIWVFYLECNYFKKLRVNYYTQLFLLLINNSIIYFLTILNDFE